MTQRKSAIEFIRCNPEKILELIELMEGQVNRMRTDIGRTGMPSFLERFTETRP